MDVLIIGNGFDLAHGLPTKYEHFLKYVDAFKRLKDICKQKSVKTTWEKANEENKNFILHFSNLYEQSKKTYEEIETLLSNNVWIDYFLGIYKSRCAVGKDGWIDFESEISRIIQTLDQARFTILAEINQGKETGRMTQRQLKILAPFLRNPGTSSISVDSGEDAIEYRKARLLTDLNRLTRCLEIYLDHYVENVALKVKLPDIDKLDVQCVLSFNYTHTYNRLYPVDGGKTIRYDYIHGEVNPDSSLEDCNLILGIDEYLNGCAKDGDNEFIQFKKFYQRIYKKTGCEYIDWERSMAQVPSNYGRFVHNIYILGHSLDITDKDILASLINTKNAKTTIFYHSQEALGNQISNLVKILGEDALISKVHGANASIVFQKQQEPIYQ